MLYSLDGFVLVMCCVGSLAIVTLGIHAKTCQQNHLTVCCRIPQVSVQASNRTPDVMLCYPRFWQTVGSAMHCSFLVQELTYSGVS